jgi:DNA polymerase-3 subunit alpha
MAFLNIEDMHGSVEVVVFPDLYAAVADVLVLETPAFVQGQVQKNEKSTKILADSVIRIADAETNWAASLHIRVDAESVEKQAMENLLAVLQKYPGACKGFMHVRIPAKTETVIALPEEMKIRAGVALRQEVNTLLGYDAVYTVCAPVHQAGAGNNGNSKSGNGKYQKKANGNGKKGNGRKKTA